MAARSKARKRAVDVLFEADQRMVDPSQVLSERGSRGDDLPNPYSAVLVRGYLEHRQRIDELLETYAVGWPLDRMPAVDRAVLRLAVFELLWVDDVPDAVVVDEAVELVKRLSTDDSPGFVNGLLGQLAQLKPSLGA
ncbi:MAG: transcription antitermination factor NusB [Actinomycetota bacterium]|nr:transcription antitermination factor NusB [Actinomycetota bacterium]